MASHALTIPITGDNTVTLIFVNLSQVRPLTPTTYYTWSSQVASFLDGLDLFKFLDGTYPSPEPTITVDGRNATNPALSLLKRQNRLILESLLGTVDSTIAPLINHAKTSQEAWQTLATSFASPSRGHLLVLKDRFNSIVKGDQSIMEYMHSIKNCTLELANLGSPVGAEDITYKVLCGLDYDTYKPVIDTVRARDTPISFEALLDKLIQQEHLLAQNHINTPFPASVHAVHHRSQFHLLLPSYLLHPPPTKTLLTTPTSPFSKANVSIVTTVAIT